MASVPRQARTDPDWVLRATWHEYPLSAEMPVHPVVRTHPHPTQLRVDLHEGIEVGVVLSGRQERQYPGWALDLTPGDVWLQPMWEPHAWRAAESDTENVVLVFLPDFLGEEKLGDFSWLSPFAAPPRYRPWVRDSDLRSATLALGRELAGEIASQERGWLTALRLGVLRLLFVVTRKWSPPSESADTFRASATDLSRVMPAIALIQERRPGTVTVEQAAAACGLSRSRFGTLFRRSVGASFGQFSLRARLGYAAHRLLTSDLPVEAIARRTGFVDASHFHRTFVKHYACTPRAYRERAR